MPDPVAWIMIEPGWKVIASDGSEVGRVHQVAGDKNVDIFDGLVLSSKKYVPAEAVGAIYEDAVHLELTKEQSERLGEYKEPAVSEQIGSEQAPNKLVQALKRAFFLDR